MEQNMWPYARYSAIAKQFGGPEKYVQHIFDSGVKQGAKSTYPLIGAAFCIGGLATIGIQKVVTAISDRRKMKKEELDMVKAQFIEKLEAYEQTPSNTPETEQNNER